MPQTIDDVKRQVAVANRLLAEFGLSSQILASLGHVSMRVPGQPDLLVVKGRGYAVDALAVVKPEEMIVVDLEGNMVDGPPGTTQCYEVKMHSCIMRSRPDVQAVCHVHPRFTIVMNLLEVPLQAMCNEGHELVRQDIPVYPHSKLILSEQDGAEVADVLGPKSAIVLRGHGAATTGATMEDAVMAMLQLEEQARMNWYAYCAVGAGYKGIPADDMDEFAAGYREIPELPHLKGPVSVQGGPKGAGATGGAWTYYSGLVSKDL